MRRPLSFVLFVFCFTFAFTVACRARYKDAFARTCVLVDENFYRSDAKLNDWLNRCRHEAAVWPTTNSLRHTVERVRDEFDQLGASHLNVFSPSVDKKFWYGLSFETGLHSHYVDGHLVVYHVTLISPAGRAGVRVGDEVLRLPGIDEVSPMGATRRSGVYHLRRGDREYDVTLSPGPTEDDFSMTVRTLKNGARLWTIPSFHSSYFAKPEVMRIAHALAGSPRVVIDLRENSGGNYTAMLRALALVLGPSVRVGSLEQPRKPASRAVLGDTLDDQRALVQMDQCATLDLVTPGGYPWFRGPVTALIGPSTASAAEAFADALRVRGGVRLMGWPTTGAVVLAVFHAIPEFGRGYSVSIPQGRYLNALGQEIEGVGLRPDRTLYHDLATSLAGEDAWINAAAR